MDIQNTFSITDDSGFLAIVNPDKYKSFVNEQWELPDLIERFVDQMNDETLIIWATGSENTWAISFVDKPSDKFAARKFDKTIEVTNGQLFLTNFEDLSVAAQFEREKVPSAHNSWQNITLDNGKYNLTIRQLFDPATNEYEVGKINFEIVVQRALDGQNRKVDTVFWWTQ